MKPTADDLRAAYEYLQTLKPFDGWKIPPSVKIYFKVNKSRMLAGEYDTDPHTIKVSSYCCQTQQATLETMAHEMVHLHLEKSKHYKHARHGKQFKACAKAVCKQFGWDVKTF